MKLLWVFFIVGSLAISLNSYSQQTSLSFKFNDVSVKDIFYQIEENSEFVFFYNEDNIDVNRKLSLNVKNETVENILNQVLKGTNNSFKIYDRQIVILGPVMEEVPSIFKLGVDQTQKIPMSGLVFGADGNPVPGVTVVIKGTTIGSITDIDGRYNLNEVPTDAILLFSFVGMKPQEVEVDGKSILNVVMQEEAQGVNEVVVVGYGVQKRLTTIGSQSSITSKDLNSQPVSNISNAISGRIAGIVAVQRSGEPGYDESEIYIRGISTFTNNNPLILVDGIERKFGNIDAEDIESFTILKDASATAVYGVRGANGVILIETKKGEVGKPKINIQANTGITQFTRTPHFADGVTYLEMANEAYKNSYPNREIPLYSTERVLKTADGSDPDLYPNVNWIDEIFSEFGHNNRINMNVSGGTDIAKYYLSLGYYDETGLFKTEKTSTYNTSIRYRRYNFTSNLSLKILKNTQLDFGASGWISNGNYPGTRSVDIWNAAFVSPPTLNPPVYSNGYVAHNRTGDVGNPKDLLAYSGYINEMRNQIWSNIRLSQNLDGLIQGLSLYGMFSFDNYNSHNISRTKTVDTYFATARDEDGELIFEQTRIGSNYLGYSRSNGGNRQFYAEAAINYENSFGKNEISGMLLYNQSEKNDAFAGDFINSIPARFQGIAARGTYAYENKYLGEVNLGYNGSETFSAGNRFGFFPSFGLGWVTSSERFFRSLSKSIQFFKIRASYGIVGNSNIGGRRFAYLSTVDPVSGYSFGNNTTVSYNGLDIGDYSVDVTWEKAKKLNLGVDMRTWENDLSLSIDLFKEIRSGIFLQRGDLPAYAGVRNTPWGNLGEVHNHGIDATLAFHKKLNQNLNIDFRGNFTWNRAIVVENANAPWPYPWQQRIGRKLGQRFGKIAIGLFVSEEEIANSAVQTGDIQPGDIKYKDLNGDGKIDSYDEGPIGYGSLPEMVFGFGPSVNYKGFAVGAWFKGIGNVDISLNGEGLQPFRLEGLRGNLFSNITDRWTPENQNPRPTYPRLTYPSTSNSNYDNSSWWIKNGAFVRLQNIELSYTFPKDGWTKKVGFSNFRIYAIGYNVATFSDFKMWDVELGDGKGAQYPLVKTYNFGFDFQF
ncbi:TonB-dependent receptor [Sunxiuqinia sp. A32]|uniref:TonB-dependent receptor n=1 Tax=Sunxiuqinia sp. A32 TaxID=3461496 RepID=UPI0040451BEC